MCLFMKKDLILFKDKNSPRSLEEITREIAKFKDDYINTTRNLILDSAELDENGETFVKNGFLILSKFGMNRGGPFAVKEITIATLQRCWEETGESLFCIKRVLNESGHPRERLLLDMEQKCLESLIDKIWDAMKLMLPFTMGATSYGLVGASKLLFAVFPEMVLLVSILALSESSNLPPGLWRILAG
jgi:hypothetical protein